MPSADLCSLLFYHFPLKPLTSQAHNLVTYRQRQPAQEGVRLPARGPVNTAGAHPDGPESVRSPCARGRAPGPPPASHRRHWHPRPGPQADGSPLPTSHADLALRTQGLHLGPHGASTQGFLKGPKVGQAAAQTQADALVREPCWVLQVEGKADPTSPG